jgi:hypothetical protein
MTDQSTASTQAQPSGAGLLVLGVLSCIFGPLTGIPGLILSRRFRPFSPTAAVGYFLCWLFLVLYVLMFLMFMFLTAKPHPVGS